MMCEEREKWERWCEGEREGKGGGDVFGVRRGLDVQLKNGLKQIKCTGPRSKGPRDQGSKNSTTEPRNVLLKPNT